MELLTISKFAEKVGVTPQAIYKRLSADLAPYLVVENGVKLLQETALELYTAKQPVSKTGEELRLEAEIEQLKAELEAERKLNNELQTELATLSKDFALKFIDLLDKQSTQFQLLLAHQQTTTQQILNANNQLNNPTTIETDTQPVENQVDKPVVKKSFISRIFKRS